LPSGQTYIDFLEGLLWLLVFQNFGLFKHQSHPKWIKFNTPKRHFWDGPMVQGAIHLDLFLMSTLFMN